MNIKGEYVLDIMFQNMFNTYNIRLRKHNLITHKGLDFILKCLVGKTNGEVFGDIRIGYNSNPASATDTIDTFQNPIRLVTDYVEIESNVMTFYATTTGDVLDGTREIGVWSSSINPIAISRDVHDPYNIPTTATITVQYSFTIVNSEK